MSERETNTESTPAIPSCH